LSKRDVRTSSDGRSTVRFAPRTTIVIVSAYECDNFILSENVVKITGIRKNTVISLYKERS